MNKTNSCKRADDFSTMFAHSLSDRPVNEWQGLEDHLLGVAQRCRSFASSFGAGDWGYLAGLWHDLGKGSDSYQQYIRNAGEKDHHNAELKGKVDHSTAGAKYAVEQLKVMGHPLAFVIAGHHAGLPDSIGTASSLEGRLNKVIDSWEGNGLESLTRSHGEIPAILRNAIAKRDAYACAFFIRMLYSCLVDADFLDTEAFMNPGNAAKRPVTDDVALLRMEKVLTAHLDRLSKEDTEVSRARKEVLQHCRAAADRDPGLFALTVPTGGGKTLSSLAFALRHAVSHGLQRVIFIVPFTSIIEQNADVYRSIFSSMAAEFGYDPVLEHHSNFDPESETTQSRLATENWDAPLIVTTAVQFYESLYANRSSRCRKLHRLSRSVIILDEAQTIPVNYLDPCLAVLRELSANYGSSVVLCTATQPAVTKREGFPIGLEEPVQIVPDPRQLYRRLKRVEVENLSLLSDEELASRIVEHDHCLCIVNTRAHARKLHALLGTDEANVHLSARMCPEHRSRVLADVIQRLKDRRKCRVITTRLIEAGVDVDFPVVYRSMTGIDSLAQAAGRCNRNGVLDGFGRVFIFQSEHTTSERYMRETASVAAQVLALHSDPLSLDAVEKYFQLYYWDQNARWDENHIMGMMRIDATSHQLPFMMQYRQMNDSFHLIDSIGRSVIVPWGERGRNLTERLRASYYPDREVIRKLQRFTVTLSTSEWKDMQDGIDVVHERFAILTNPKLHYSEIYGVVGDLSYDTAMIY